VLDRLVRRGGVNKENPGLFYDSDSSTVVSTTAPLVGIFYFEGGAKWDAHL